jgi:hypothetical protein
LSHVFFFESILQECEPDKIDVLALLRLQNECSQVKTFKAFCNTLALEKWSEPIRTEMIQWQTALGLSHKKLCLVMNLPLTKLTAALQLQNLSPIPDVAAVVSAIRKHSVADGGAGDLDLFLT